MPGRALAPGQPGYLPTLYWLQCEHARSGARIYWVDASFFMVRLYGEEAVFGSLLEALLFCEQLIAL